MAQDSFPWGCSPATGDAGAVTVNDLVNLQMFGSNTSPNTDGVVYWTSTSPLPGGTNAVNGLLEPSEAGGVVSIATGIGIVQGWNFVNDTVATFNFNADPGNANAIDIIVLERGNPVTNLTVRLARVKGPAGGFASLTQSELLWQVPIAYVPVNSSGIPTGFQDVRRFVGQTMSWRRGGNVANWGVAGTTNYLVGNVKIQAGVTSSTLLAGQNIRTFDIVYPQAFDVPPIPVITLSAFPTNLPIVLVGIIAQFTDFCTITVATSTLAASGVNVDVNAYWYAIGNYA